MRSRMVDVGAVELAILESGAGGDPMLLVHGFCGAKEDFAEWLDRLGAEGWHAVAVDSRGHGASSRPEGLADYTFDLLADDVLGLAEVLWGDAPFVLLGHSMGGAIAQVVARRAPERLRGLVLMDTTHRGLELDPSQVELACSIVEQEGMDALADAMAARGEDPLSTPAHRRLLAERPGYAAFGDRKLRASSPAMYRAMLPAFFAYPDHLDALAEFPAPCLVLVGEQDQPFREASERMAKAIPGARLAVIPDAGHSPQFENPEAWWATLTQFLEEVR